MRNLFLIIQARMTSTRLPGKVMLEICGVPVLELMLRRLEQFRNQIIIATTDDGSEAPIIALSERLGIRCFRGSTDDVLERYYRAASHFGARAGDTVVRCTSDCPLIDPEIAAKTIACFEEGPYDYVSAGVHSGYPRGMDTEVFGFDLLAEAHREATTGYEREHVTPYIYVTKKTDLNIGSLKDASDHSRYRLTLDEPDDYRAIRAVYEGLGCRTDFTYTELIGFLQAHPHIHEMNRHVEQKKS